MRSLIILLLTGIFYKAAAETPSQMICGTYNKFAVVKDFKSAIDVHFDIPAINISEMKGRVFYAAPNKFKIKLKGVAFLPKQSPFELYDFLKDSTQYVAVSTGSERIQNTNCAVLSVLPKTEQDIVIEKIWIDNATRQIVRSEVTTKSRGTIKAEYYYNGPGSYPLPARVVFNIDVTKFKLPKMISADLNTTKKAAKTGDQQKGTIIFDFHDYIVNKGVAPADFKD